MPLEPSRFAVVVASLALSTHLAFGQPIVATGDLPLTVAESSEFTKTASFDDVWEWIPPAFPEAVTLLRRHGIAVDRLESSWSGTVQVFGVESITVADRLFQGHRALTVDGDYRTEARDVPAGWYYVSTAQPLGALVFTLLEPEMLDGLTSWNYFDRLRQTRAARRRCRWVFQSFAPRRGTWPSACRRP